LHLYKLFEWSTIIININLGCASQVFYFREWSYLSEFWSIEKFPDMLDVTPYNWNGNILFILELKLPYPFLVITLIVPLFIGLYWLLPLCADSYTLLFDACLWFFLHPQMFLCKSKPCVRATCLLCSMW